MAYNPLNPNGQATMANSGPVVVASDQSSIPVKSAVATGGTPGTNDFILVSGKSDVTGVATPIRVKETTGKVVVTLDGNSSVLSQSTFTTGATSSIGTSQVQLVATGTNSMALTIKADPSNTGIVYVGKTGLTAGTTDATDGFPLWAGDSLDIYFNTLSSVYLIASASSQKVWWMAN